jgi:rSAM/selenodomain-associated transferase 1
MAWGLDDMDTDCKVLFFLKWPEAGKVKTRLGEKIGDEAAAELYANFVLDELEMLKTLDVPLTICFHPAERLSYLRRWLGEEYDFMEQKGKDLGSRMRNAFAETFATGYKKTVLIGSDVPDMEGRVLVDAFESLEENDAVIGPTVDGGYYLIGFRGDSFRSEVFEGMEWSTSEVFAKTLEKFDGFGDNYQVGMLDTLQDVDTLDDLLELMQRNSDNVHDLWTIAYICENELKIAGGKL